MDTVNLNKYLHKTEKYNTQLNQKEIEILRID